MEKLDQMVSTPRTSAHKQRGVRLLFALRIALREFRGGVRGLFVFLASIALGVGAIVGVGSVSLALKDGLAKEGRAILGADVSFDVSQRELTLQELDFLKSRGRVAAVSQLRTMARTGNGEASLVEIKAVDESYPLAEGPVLDPPLRLSEALDEREGAFGLAADPALLGRLGLRSGDHLSIGSAQFQIRALVTYEPDRLASSIRFGPLVLISEKALHATGLLEPGSLVKRHYRVALYTNRASDDAIEGLVAAAKEKFPRSGWDIRTRKNISPQFSRNLDRFTEFLTLVGLTSLIVGGAGVANAIEGLVERKRNTIAILKAVGAAGSTVFALMLMQAMLAATIGALIGAAGGAALPFIGASAFGAFIPFPIAPAIYPSAIAKGLLYGLLTALAFSALPLGRARDIPVQALFRGQIEERRTRPRTRYIILVLVAALCLVAAAFAFAADAMLVWIYSGAILGAFLLLRGAGFLIAAVAKKLPHARDVALRLAISNIHRPGALTPSVVLSLGLGLALLVALTLIDGSIRAELHHGVAGKTPSFFFLDVPNARVEDFTGFLKAQAPDGNIELVPMLRGRIVKLKGMKAETIHPKQSAAWVLEGDRGITFAQSIPEGSRLADGAWWPADYRGPNLVSLEAGIAQGLGLAIGDELTVNVLGRDVTATIASTRKVDWLTLGINFVLVFSPNSFAGAPYSDLAALTFADKPGPGKETALFRSTSRSFPQVTILRVKDALDAFNNVVGELALAVRAASGAAFLASVLVLGGALAAGQNARIREAVVLKTLGATRPRLLAAYIYEFALIGTSTALFGVAAGVAASYGVVRGIMELEFQWLWSQALLAAAAAAALTVLIGLLGTWRILGRSPAPYLRDL
ncbi:MAG: FtsX-like permease family protein [Methylocapsa sp.]|nr:FtsX-like permease family protein [Methylocapsa sp.]